MCYVFCVFVALCVVLGDIERDYKDFFFNLYGYVKGKEKEELSGDDKEEKEPMHISKMSQMTLR